MKKTLFIILTFLISTTAIAEYRVFQYYVKSRLEKSTDKNSYLVTSTLDPVSYLSYHGGNTSIKIDLVRTWSCVGYTGGNQPLCKGPNESAQALLDKNKIDN